MKLKQLLYLTGVRPPVREYTYDLVQFPLPKDGPVDYAYWRHPKEVRKARKITQPRVDAVRRFVREGDVAIDIGAHVGDTAVPIALAAGPRGAVFALEPNPYVFKILLANAALNRDRTNIFPLNFAATAEDGRFEFHYSDAGYSNGGRFQGVSRFRHAQCVPLQVQGRNLHRYLQEHHPDHVGRVRYIKIDTEGFDRQVVASLRELIRATRPVIRSEIHRHTSAAERTAYLGDLHKLGYRVHRFKSLHDHLGEPIGAGEMMNWQHFDIVAVPDEAPLPGKDRHRPCATSMSG